MWKRLIFGIPLLVSVAISITASAQAGWLLNTSFQPLQQTTNNVTFEIYGKFTSDEPVSLKQFDFSLLGSSFNGNPFPDVSAAFYDRFAMQSLATGFTGLGPFSDTGLATISTVNEIDEIPAIGISRLLGELSINTENLASGVYIIGFKDDFGFSGAYDRDYNFYELTSSDSASFTISAVPEPASIVIWGLGSLVAGFLTHASRRKRL